MTKQELKKQCVAEFSESLDRIVEMAEEAPSGEVLDSVEADVREMAMGIFHSYLQKSRRMDLNTRKGS